MLELELHSFQEGVVSKVPSSVLTAERTDSTRILLDFYSKQVFLYNIQMSACCRVHHFPLQKCNTAVAISLKRRSKIYGNYIIT